MSRKFLKIKKPTREHPSLQIKGNCTYSLRDTFRENGFRWNPDDKCWETVYIVSDGMTTKDLQTSAMSTIDAITIAASLEGMAVYDDKNDTSSNSHKVAKKSFGSRIDFDAIKNTKKIYPDGTKMGKQKTKYYQQMYGSERGSVAEDAMNARMNKEKNRIELRGSTYYNREWLKKTFSARFCPEDKVWWIDASNVTLEKIKSILEDFGVLKKPKKVQQCIDIKLPRPPIVRAIAAADSDDPDYDRNHNKKRSKRQRFEDNDSDDFVPKRRRKRRKIEYEDTEDDMDRFEMDIVDDFESSEDLDDFVVDDDIIEYESDYNMDTDDENDYKAFLEPPTQNVLASAGKEINGVKLKPLTDSQAGLLQIQLTELRQDLKKQHNVKTLHQVFSDMVMVEFAKFAPILLEDLSHFEGFNGVKLKRYGESIVELICDFINSNELKSPFERVHDSLRKSKQESLKRRASKRTKYKNRIIIRDDEEIFEVPIIARESSDSKRRQKEGADERKEADVMSQDDLDETNDNKEDVVEDAIIEDVKKEDDIKKEVKVEEKNKEEVEEEEEEEEEDECVICMDGKREYLAIPCGHLCLCGKCKDSIKQCPMCRADCTVIKLYK